MLTGARIVPLKDKEDEVMNTIAYEFRVVPFYKSEPTSRSQIRTRIGKMTGRVDSDTESV